MKKEHLAAGYSVSQTASQLYWCTRTWDFSYPRAERREKSVQSTGSLCVYLKDGLAWSGGFFLQDWHNQEKGWGLDFFPVAVFVLSNWQVFLSIGEKSRHCPVALPTHPPRFCCSSEEHPDGEQ